MAQKLSKAESLDRRAARERKRIETGKLYRRGSKR